MGGLWPIWAAGFSAGLGLIVAIGAQNAFVLRQGLMGAHVFWVCLACALSDAILIVAGVVGFGALVEAVPAFPDLMRWLGAAFLAVYGALRFRAAWQGSGGLAAAGGTGAGLRPTIATALAFTWANPHVYLDTVVLLGGIASRHEGEARVAFGFGAVTASFAFFFALGYGARAIGPVLASRRAWRVIDAAIGALMWALAWLLLTKAL